MRERGTQSRRRRAADDTPGATPRTAPDRPTEPGPARWQAVAIIAIIVATAGWTTVAIMALNGGGATVATVPTPSDDAGETLDDLGADASDEPIEELHEALDLEALLPTEIDGTALETQSWTGDTLLSDGGTWSTAIASFLTSVGKTPADLAAAQALDPLDAIDHSVGVFRVDGVPTEDLRDALANAWKADYPELVTSTVTLGDIEVVKGDFGEDAIDSYWFVKDGLLFDVESSDEAIATAVLAQIRDGSAARPAASAAPSPN